MIFRQPRMCGLRRETEYEQRLDEDLVKRWSPLTDKQTYCFTIRLKNLGKAT